MKNSIILTICFTALCFGPIFGMDQACIAEQGSIDDLYRAIQEEDLSEVRRLCSNPAIDINYCGTTYTVQTPLIKASHGGNPGIISAVLSVPGIDVNVRDRDGHGAFANICRLENAEELIHLFISADLEGRLNPRLDINGPWWGNRTTLHYAVAARKWRALELLSSLDTIDANTRRADGKRSHVLHVIRELPMDETVCPGTLSQIFFNLVERGMVVSPQIDVVPLYSLHNEQQQSPLDGIIHDRRRRPLPLDKYLWPLLCAFGAFSTPQQMSALSLPTNTPDDKIARHFWQGVPLDKAFIDTCIEEGADIHRPDTYSSLCPFMILAAQGRVEDFKKFLSWFPETDLNVRACNGWHALHFAAFNGHEWMVWFLLSRPEILLNLRTTSGLTLQQAALLGQKAHEVVTSEASHSDVIKLLEDFSKRKRTVLMCVDHEGMPYLPIELLEHVVNSYRFGIILPQ